MNPVARLDRYSFFFVCGVELAEIVLDAAGHSDQLHPCGSMRGPEAVCTPARHEHETAGPDLKVIVAADHRQLTFEHVERLMLLIVDVKRRPALHGDFEHA